MSNIQTEELVWHKYPEDCFPLKRLYEDQWFMLTHKGSDGLTDITNEALFLYRDSETGEDYFSLNGEFGIESEDILAIAKMPKGWKE